MRGGASDRLRHVQALASGVNERALTWVLEHLAAFHPDHPHVSDHQLRIKPFIELIFVLNPMLRLGLHHGDARLQVLQDFIRQTFASYDFAAFAQQDPAGLIVFALRDEFLRLSNDPAADDGLLEKFMRTGLPEMVSYSRSPYRIMDLHYTLDRARLHHDPGRYLQVLPDTVLGRGKPVVQCSDHDLYSITHTLFYLADLGAWPLTQIWPDTAPLQERLTAALGMSLRQSNADLAGEFLMCLGFLGAQADPAAELAWTVLAGQQLPGGGMPAPSYRSERDTDPQDEYQFVQCYHTTLVMLGAALPLLAPAQEVA